MSGFKGTPGREVKRYDPFGYDGLSALMHEDVLGDYVRHEDYDALLAERDALIASSAKWKRDSELLDAIEGEFWFKKKPSWSEPLERWEFPGYLDRINENPSIPYCEARP